ncbi:hypothetical protein D3C87_1305070 [compost metagenome]
MTTLAQAVAQHGGLFAQVVHQAIHDWCKTATADEIKAAFFPERAGVEIFVPQPEELADEPDLQGVGEVYVIKNSPFTLLTNMTIAGEVPFIFHDKDTAREMAKAHNIPCGNIIPADMWKLDK